MPHDQQHPMEQTLRAWAATRRQQAGGPFALHPADRARLQAEIARAFGPDAQPAPAAALAWRRFLPRLAFALGAAVLLLLAIQQLAPTRNDSSMDLARHEAPTTPESGRSPAAAPVERFAELHLDLSSAPPEPGSPGLAESSPRLRVAPDSGEVHTLQHYGLQPLVSDAVPPLTSVPAPEASYPPAARDRALSMADSPRPTMPSPEARAMRQPAPRPQAGPTQMSRLTAPPDGVPAKPGSDRAAGLAPVIGTTTAVAPALAPAPADPSKAASLEAATSAVTAGQPPDWAGEFTRPQAPRRNLNAPPDYALRSFRVEQRGTTLRLLDEDGSVYDGIIVSGQPASAPASTSFAKDPHPPGSVGFRVSGTNRSARNDLVFQGVLVTGATVRIQGHAILGGRDRIVVDARGTAD
jgi:hypothetical protein